MVNEVSKTTGAALQRTPTPPPAGVRGRSQLGPQRWVGSQKQQGRGCTPGDGTETGQKTMVEASEHDCRAVNRRGGPRVGYVRGQGRRGSPGEGWGPMLEATNADKAAHTSGRETFA